MGLLCIFGCLLKSQQIFIKGFIIGSNCLLGLPVHHQLGGVAETRRLSLFISREIKCSRPSLDRHQAEALSPSFVVGVYVSFLRPGKVKS
jgi:hypothetical protein